MKVYRPLPGSWAGIHFGLVITTVTICGAVALAVETGLLSLLRALEFLAPVVGGIVVYGLRRQKRWWESFEISLTEDAIVQRAAYGPEIKLQRLDVTDVLEGPGAGSS